MLNNVLVLSLLSVYNVGTKNVQKGTIPIIVFYTSGVNFNVNVTVI